jgi:hypothetical protein
MYEKYRILVIRWLIWSTCYYFLKSQDFINFLDAFYQSSYVFVSFFEDFFCGRNFSRAAELFSRPAEYSCKPVLWIRMVRAIRILPLSSKKKVGKTWFLLFCDFFLILYLRKLIEMYLQKVISKKTLKKTNFLQASCWLLTKKEGSRSGSQRRGSADPDPDPYQNVTDPQHCW